MQVASMRDPKIIYFLIFVSFIIIYQSEISYSQDLNETCLDCHNDKSLVRERKGAEGTSVYVDKKKFISSVHKDILCIDCHLDANVEEFPHKDSLDPVNCGLCHSEIKTQYHFATEKVYQKKHIPVALQKLNKCVFCHGKHDILPKTDENSTTYRFNIPFTCGQCHGDHEESKFNYTPVQFESPEFKTLKDYQKGAHGIALYKGGLSASAVCSDCHNAHDENLLQKDRRLSVEVCAKCHLGVYKDFKKSIHATAKIEEPEKAAVCSACHSNHDILKVDTDSFKMAIVQQCGKCHKELLDSYFKSYHGKVNQLGYKETAKCSDCHMNHLILKVKDPKSSLFGKNRLKTCQKCHSKATMAFAYYVSHIPIHDAKKYPVLFYTQLLMEFLLISVFLFFGLHSLLWLSRQIYDRFKFGKIKKIKAYDTKEKFILRFNLFNRITHFVVITSFLGLVSTGIILKFSETSWAQKLVKVFGGFSTAGFIHHFFGFVTFGYFISHLLSIFFTFMKGDRKLLSFFWGPNSLIPMPSDAINIYKSLKWFFHLGEKPKLDRWTYWEKFDYFAVFWGVAIIGSSGLILLFPEFFTRFLPGIVINIAAIVHSDEALLAAGFIFTVHFFNSHLRIGKFPFDPVIFTGRITLEELKEERPQEYERLVESGELEKNFVNPLNTTDWILVNIVSYTALTIGLILLILILSSIFI
jgi:cytochrome b subunit of formate dehydrogenase